METVNVLTCYIFCRCVCVGVSFWQGPSEGVLKKLQRLSWASGLQQESGTNGLNEDLIAFSEASCGPIESFKFLRLVKLSERERERDIQKPGVVLICRHKPMTFTLKMYKSNQVCGTTNNAFLFYLSIYLLFRTSWQCSIRVKEWNVFGLRMK